MNNDTQIDSRNGLFMVWLTWIISSGAILFVLLVPLFLRPIFAPIFAVVIEVVLWQIIRQGREGKTTRCLLPLFISSRILFWSALTMLGAILIIRSMPPAEIIALGINKEIPFIPVLVMAPTGALVCGWMLLRGHRFPFCVDCKLRLGTPAERGFLGILYSQEGVTQVKVLLMGFILQSVAAIPYYLVNYVNESLTHADIYFFFGIPAALWLIGTCYMTLRYVSIWRYYDQDLEGSLHRHGSSTRLRFLIVGDNRLLVSRPTDIAGGVADLRHAKADTPAKVTLPYRERVPIHEAEHYLKGILSLHDPKVKFLFSTTEWDVRCNVFHYVVNVADEDIEYLSQTVNGAEWLSLRDYNILLSKRALEPILSAEIYRIYTSAMAFKTYDRAGRRLYPIKHYHPTFRLGDVINYGLDFNDRHWLYVAHCNQDQPLYRLKSFWRRHISGLSY